MAPICGWTLPRRRGGRAGIEAFCAALLGAHRDVGAFTLEWASARW